MNDDAQGRSVPALSFGGVAAAYDRARPPYPREAATWLTGSTPARILELGAGTGKLTESLVALGHQVFATDPIPEMLRLLAARLPQARPTRAVAENIPVASRSVDVVVSAQAFHWFDLDRALPEIARVLRPGGEIALVWNLRDERIPWVRRLGELIGTQDQENEPTNALLGSQLFGYVEKARFRFWQPMNRAALRDMVASRSNVATMNDSERQRLLHKVDDLYDEYGRGMDGMQMPYVTHCYKAVVRPYTPPEPAQAQPPSGQAPTPPGGPDGRDGGRDGGRDDGPDTDALLIDFS